MLGTGIVSGYPNRPRFLEIIAAGDGMQQSTMKIPQLHTNTRTFFGRYWTEHRALQRYMANRSNLNILSFGCSSGEELLTMRALFPAASLVGCEVDEGLRAQAANALGEEAIVIGSDAAALRNNGPYHVILCNSVLMRPTEMLDARAQGIDRSVWVDVLGLLDELLAPGGVLQVINSNIPFRFHPVSDGYQPVHNPRILGPNFVDLFDLEGRFLCAGIGGTGWSAHMHLHRGEESWPLLRPEDFTDVHFYKAGGLPLAPEPSDPEFSNRPRAHGVTSYSVDVPTDDPRPPSFVEVETKWWATTQGEVLLERSARRVWFDGSSIPIPSVLTAMAGASASALVEAGLGQGSTHIALEELLAGKTSGVGPIRADAF